MTLAEGLLGGAQRQRRIVVVNGHPDPSGERYCAALTAAYLRGANAAGHQIRRLDIGALKLEPVHSADEFAGTPPTEALAAQEAIRWADHLVLVYPLWQGAAPAALKAFFEQVFRYGFSVAKPGESGGGLLRGKSARVVVTMGMPAPAFSLVFDKAGVKAISRGLLGLSGFSVRDTIIGGVESSVAHRKAWLRKLEAMGERAE